MRPVFMRDPSVFLRLSLEQAVERGDMDAVHRLSEQIDREMIRLNAQMETAEQEDAG